MRLELFSARRAIAAAILALACIAPRGAARAQDAATPASASATTRAVGTSGTTHAAGDVAANHAAAGHPAPSGPSGAAASGPSEADDEESDGRGADLLWIEAIGGYSYVNMRAISYDNLYPSVVALSGSGYAGGLAAGVRFSFVSLGARATLASYEGFEVGTASAEITLRLPTPVVEPWVRAGFGYGWHGNANYDEPSLSQTNVYGYVIQAAAGIDIYFGKFVAVGAGFDVDVLNLSRQPLTLGPGTASPTGVDLTKDGNAVGLQLRGHVALSLHF